MENVLTGNVQTTTTKKQQNLRKTKEE